MYEKATVEISQLLHATNGSFTLRPDSRSSWTLSASRHNITMPMKTTDLVALRNLIDQVLIELEVQFPIPDRRHTPLKPPPKPFSTH